MKLAIAALVLVCAASANAQGNCDRNSSFAFCRALGTVSKVQDAAPPPKFPDGVDCTKIHSPGCPSFNELVNASDKGILGFVNKPAYTAMVCFHDDIDQAVIISYALPPKSWLKDVSGVPRRFPQLADVVTYINGIQVSHRTVLLTWIQFSSDAPSASGEGLDKETHLAIDPDTITYVDTFTNAITTVTTRNLTVQISTRRFSETLSAKDVKGEPVNDRRLGHCVRYENGFVSY
jgi:hypothetical protein